MIGSPRPPAASLVIPLLRQREDWLREAVSSALAQTVPTDVFVITSRDTPASNLGVLEELAPAGRLVMARQTGRGFANAVNTGISLASTDRVGLLLSDDWLDADAVEQALAVDADIVSTGAHRFTADARPLPHLRRALSPERYARRTTLEQQASYLTHFFLFRRKRLLDAGGLDESLGDAPGIDDYDLIWTLLERGAPVGFTGRPLYNQRVHDGERLTMRPREDQVRTLERIFDKHGFHGDARARRLAEQARWFGRPEDEAHAELSAGGRAGTGGSLRSSGSPPAGRRPDVSVLLATRLRAGSLAETLRSLSAMDTGSLAWELVVIDNAGDAATARAVEAAATRLPVQLVVEPSAGKNRALNRGLARASGPLVVFTDDDVTVDGGWLRELVEGARRWPEATMFGGRILPQWPDGHAPPAGQPFMEHAFAIADFARDEGPYSAGYVYGPNMAIRASVFESGWRFNQRIGPDGTDVYVPGSETSLTVALERKAGHCAVYLPRAVVHHRIRPEQLTSAWLNGRAFRRGRAVAQKQGRRARSRHGARALLLQAGREYLAAWACRLQGDDAGAFENEIAYWTTRGMIHQRRGMRASRR